MNRSMVKPWVLPSALPLPTCSWRCLKLKLLAGPNPPPLAKFGDDILVIHKAEHSTQVLHPINSQDPNIQFTVEQPGTHGSIPLLDIKVTPVLNNTIYTIVYRKPAHTD